MEKIFTERAHLMCPHMIFGIAMSVNSAFEKNRIEDSFRILAKNHPLLRAVIGHDETDNSYFYAVTEASKIEMILPDEPITGPEDPSLLEEFDRLTSHDWNIMEEGLLKAVVWSCESKTIFLLAFHHLLADGRGALYLASELAEIYAEGKVGNPVTEKLISSKADFPKGSELSFISRVLVNKANRDWDKEGNESLSYTRYHEFAEDFLKGDKVRFSLEKTAPGELENVAKKCKENEVTVNDYLMAKAFLEDGTDKIIIAKDLRNVLPFYNEGALGNYSTAFSIVMKKKDGGLWSLAKRVHKEVRKAVSDPKALYLVLQCYAILKPEVLDAAFMAAKGGFSSKSARFIGEMFFGFSEPKGFSITNLGKIESKSIDTAFFIPPSSPAIRKTLGVLTVNGEMITCISERDK